MPRPSSAAPVLSAEAPAAMRGPRHVRESGRLASAAPDVVRRSPDSPSADRLPHAPRGSRIVLRGEHVAAVHARAVRAGRARATFTREARVRPATARERVSSDSTRPATDSPRSGPYAAPSAVLTAQPERRSAAPACAVCGSPFTSAMAHFSHVMTAHTTTREEVTP